jgi:oligopeptide transport system permease protein
LLIRRWLEVFALALFIFNVVWSFLGYHLPTFLLVGNLALIVLFFAIHAVTQGLTLYVVKRLGQTVFVLWVITSLTFILLRVLPGGPFDAEKALPPEVKANIEAKYKLHDPVLKQYLDYLGGVVTGDLGQSYKYIGRDVSDIVAESFPASFQLGVFSLILAFLVGIPAGVYAASKHNTWADSFIMISAVSSVSLPSFLVAAIFILIFSFKLDWLPVALWDGPQYYILPVVVLGLRPAAIIARLTRASVLDVIRSDYIRTAKAKGLAQHDVLFKHVLKNSLIPVLTFAGPLTAGVLSGSFVIEHIFNIPGIGKHFIESVSNRDYPLVLALTLMFAFMLVLANLVVDLLYTYFDPRIKLG